MNMIHDKFDIIIMIIKIILLSILLLFSVAYLIYIERKVIGYIQSRIGPNRVGLYGLLQPFADLIKLITKEIIIPSNANIYLFVIAPLFAIVTALVEWSVIPLLDYTAISNIDSAILFIFSISSLNVYSILMSGWASNSKYSMFGAMRSAAQVISYEISMGFSLVGVVLASNSMNLTKIVYSQTGGILHWWFIPLFPLFIIFWISMFAEVNRAPFDLAEGESEIVAGFHVEYSGIGFSLFFLAEYLNMILLSVVIVILFLGGWLSPFEKINIFRNTLFSRPGMLWLFIKTIFFLFFYLWVRATFPRYRYDQLMYLGWKKLIPISIIWIIIVSAMIKINLKPWF